MKKKKIFLLGITLTSALLLTACDCKHEKAERQDVAAATCTEDGFTGNLVCPECKEVLEKGEIISAKGHTPGEVTGVIESTCQTEGYTGDTVCADCGEIISHGETVQMLAHEETLVNDKEATCLTPGYTGDLMCAMCQEILTVGEEIPVLPHDFEDNTCKACGWQLPGLYENGKMELTWEQVAETYIDNMDEECIIAVIPALMGDLVVDESVQYLAENAFSQTQLTSITLPVTIDVIPAGAFEEAPNLEKVTAFGCIQAIEDSAFKGCQNLKSFEFGEGLSLIGQEAFRNSGITTILLPATVTRIKQSAFSECADLESVLLNEGLKEIGQYAFAMCPKLTELKLPASLEVIGQGVVNESGVNDLEIPDTVKIEE